MTTKKYVSLSKLQTFLENLTNKFASLAHTHTISDITDYTGITVDTTLSPTSSNPVANSTLDAEFEAISNAMGVLESTIDGKADSAHTHDDLYYTKADIDDLELITVEDIDSICGATIQVASTNEVTF